jgi:hypothetical protein
MADMYHPTIVIWLIEGAFLIYWIYRFLQVVAYGPTIAKSDIVYQEWFASGYSEANPLTQMLSCQRCLRLVVTRDLVWVTSWFPFSLVTCLSDVEHVASIANIESVAEAKQLWLAGVRLIFRDSNDRKCSLFLIPQKSEMFLSVVRRAIDDQVPKQP